MTAADPVGQLTLEFQGLAIGAYVVAGPAAAVLEREIDGRAFEPVNLSRYLCGLFTGPAIGGVSKKRPSSTRRGSPVRFSSSRRRFLSSPTTAA